jgi:hypothetical protein
MSNLRTIRIRKRRRNLRTWLRWLLHYLPDDTGSRSQPPANSVALCLCGFNRSESKGSTHA